MSSPRRVRVLFLTYFASRRNPAPSGGEIYHERVFARLRASPRCAWSEHPHDRIPAPLRSRWLSSLWFAARFLLAPPDIALVDSGYLGRCAWALPILRLRGRQVVLMVHHLNFHTKAGRLARFYDYLAGRLGFASASRAILNSEFTRREVGRWYGFRKPALLIHPTLSFPSAPPRPRDYRTGPVRCLCVGSLEPRKHVDVLVRLANEAPAHLDFRITVVGKDTLHPEYARDLRAAVRRPDRIDFAGYMDAEALRELYASSHLFLFPSLWEGFGMAALEALASGLPVIAFAASALPDLVEDGVNGMLVPPYDDAAFVEAACRLFADRALLERLAGESRLPAGFEGGWEEKAEKAEAFLLEGGRTR